MVILATGYKYIIPEFLKPICDRINWTSEGFYHITRNYAIDDANTLFVQNAGLHSHGFNSADLGIGPYRSATILNTILKRQEFKLEKDIAFQYF